MYWCSLIGQTIWATTSHAARGSLVGPFPDCTRILDAAGWVATCYSVDPGGALLISVGFSRKVALENSDQFVHSCSLLKFAPVIVPLLGYILVKAQTHNFWLFLFSFLSFSRNTLAFIVWDLFQANTQ